MRFPEALELLTGKFLRHSTEFYQWRIRDRITKLKSEPSNLAYFDDLAVAYEKVGNHEQAIETMLRKEQIEPGLYETYSNLGTFYILAGEFEKGLPYIDKALAINPDAHFGREKYQKWLVEYAMDRMKDGRLNFPMREVTKEPKMEREHLIGFHAFLFFDHDEVEQQKAIKGVLGMMRFANHENPLLLEALGDLLFVGGHSGSSGLLAARAYLRASYVVNDPEAKGKYRTLAEQALSARYSQKRDATNLPDLEANFQQELADAQDWYDSLYAKELKWIRDGKDVEAEFDKLYVKEPGIEGQTNRVPLLFRVPSVILMGGLVAILALILGRRRRVRKVLQY